MAKKSAKKAKKPLKCPLPSSRSIQIPKPRVTRSSQNKLSTPKNVSKSSNSLPSVKEEGFREIVKFYGSNLEMGKILLVTYSHQDNFGISDQFLTDLKNEITQKNKNQNQKNKNKNTCKNEDIFIPEIQSFEKSTSTEILNSINYLFNSKAIVQIEKLIPNKTCILAITKKSNSANNYELLSYLANIESNARSFASADEFVTKVRKAHQKFLKKNPIQKSLKSSSSKLSKNSAGGTTKKQQLISYQNFQYKLSTIRDEMRNLKIVAKNSRRNSLIQSSSKNSSGNQKQQLYRDIKILFSDLRNGNAELVRCSENETLFEVLSRSRSYGERGVLEGRRNFYTVFDRKYIFILEKVAWFLF